MKFKKTIIRNSIAILLFSAFILPNITQLAHLFENHHDHEHVSCSTQTTHIHKSEVKCKICGFHFASFTNTIVNYTDNLHSNITVKTKVNCTSLQLHSFYTNNKQLRGPPIFS